MQFVGNAAALRFLGVNQAPRKCADLKTALEQLHFGVFPSRYVCIYSNQTNWLPLLVKQGLALAADPTKTPVGLWEAKFRFVWSSIADRAINGLLHRVAILGVQHRIENLRSSL